MGHEKKKKKDKDRDRERKKHRHESAAPGEDLEPGREPDSERRHRHKHKKHKDKDRSERDRQRSERKRRHPSVDAVSAEPAAGGPPLSVPPPPKLSRLESHTHAAPAAPPPPRISRASPGAEEAGKGGGGGDISLSIEETNRLRLKLGLRPLDVAPAKQEAGEPGEQAQTENSGPRLGSSDTYAIHKPAEHLGEKKKTEKMRERLSARKEARRLEERLARTRGLGESDEEGADSASASAWVQRSRRLQKEKEMASRRAAVLDDLDAEFGIGDLVEADTRQDRSSAYTTSDLRGLVVEHEQDQFREGRDVILTIKDRGVLDEGDDVLVNVNMVDDERHEKNVRLRKKKPGYRADDQEEWDEEGNFVQKAILSQYDEETEGQKKKSFVIGESGSGAGASAESRANAAELVKQKLKQKSKQTLQTPALQLASEFYSPEEMVSFKKVKKKVRKVRKKDKVLRADDLLPLADTDQSAHRGSRGGGARVKRDPSDGEMEPATDDLAVPEDDLTGVKLEADEETDAELSAAIDRARRLRQSETEPGGGGGAAETSVALLAARVKPDPDAEPESGQTGSIVLNSTAEFCRSLGDIPTYGMAGNRDEEAEEMAALERELAEERRRAQEAAAGGGAWEEVGIDTTPAPLDPLPHSTILEDEPDVGSGMANALKLARQKGYIEHDTRTKKGASQQVLSHLRAQNYSIEDKSGEEDRRASRHYQHGPVSEFREKSNYKPDVKLEYIDDQGRLLNQKEAFRYLSHKFHGKGSGKMKTEKREKKYQEKLVMSRMHSTDTPLNTLSRLQERQKELQSPFVVLTGAKNMINAGASGSQVSKN